MKWMKMRAEVLDEWLWKELKECLEEGIDNVFIPAGGTPKAFYQLFREKNPSLVKRFTFYQIDEVITGSKKGIFWEFFKENLGSFIDQLVLISKENQFNSGEKFVAFLGLGVNGHVAFHEPHLSRDFTFGPVELSHETCRYLDLEEGTKGMTYGIGHFLKAEKIFLMIKGNHKREIVKRLHARDPRVPAVALLDHPGLFLLIDDEASSGMTFDE